MNSDKIVGRLLVLEAFAMTALAIALEKDEDPGRERARRMLKHLCEATAGLAGEVSDRAREEAVEYGKRLSVLVLANLRNAG